MGAGIWWVVSSCIALVAGGYVAAWLAGIELRFDGMLHGLVAWGRRQIPEVGSRMREIRPYGSVRGAHGDVRPYRDRSCPVLWSRGAAAAKRKNGRNTAPCAGFRGHMTNIRIHRRDLLRTAQQRSSRLGHGLAVWPNNHAL